jgi:hypothetical protein
MHSACRGRCRQLFLLACQISFRTITGLGTENVKYVQKQNEHLYVCAERSYILEESAMKHGIKENEK